MTVAPYLRETRGWVVTAAGLAQVAAARAGMLPWWALPMSIVLTIAVARQTGPVDEKRARATQFVAVAAVAVFAAVIAVKAIAAGRDGTDPLATMRLLTEALVVLSLIMAPVWRSPRDYRVWLSVTTGVLIAATFGAHSVTTDVLLVVTWVLVLLALASVERGALLASATLAERPPCSHPSSSGGLGAATPVLTSLTAGVLVFLALPAGLGGGGIATHLVHPTGSSAADGQISRSVIGVDTGGNGDLDLLVRGALPTTPLLAVPADSPPLWRGSIYTTYTGNSWLADLNEGFAFARGNSVAVPPSTTDPRPAGTTRTDTVRFAAGVNSSLVWAPGVPLHLRGVGGEIRGIARGPANVRLIRLGDSPAGYRVRSAVATTSPAALRTATGPSDVGGEWTALPPELPAGISALAHEITAGTKTRYAKVNALEAYLRSHETYSLTSPVPGPGEDAVADFLLRDHVGFCEQFASAEAVMLRTLGIPARVVSGLAYGTIVGATRVFTDADAHAWVEVYYPGVGWSPTDPTAGVRLAKASPTPRARIDALLHRVAGDLPGGRIGLVAVLLALILLVGLTIQNLRNRSLRSHADRVRRPAFGPVLGAFHRFAAHRRASTSRAPSETAREYVRRLAPEGRLDPAVTTLEQECYGADPPGEHQVIEAVAAFDAERGEPVRSR
jgi:protein-glutamine gamma-glutamyltransferase